MRNGPTRLLEDGDRNAKSDVIAGAMRGEAVVVNQLEVQSIANLRLAYPTRPIRLITADRFGLPHGQPGDDPALADLPHFAGPSADETCTKDPPDAMFSPSFMACVMRYGRALASRNRVWIELSEPDQGRAAPGASR